MLLLMRCGRKEKKCRADNNKNNKQDVKRTTSYLERHLFIEDEKVISIMKI